MRRSLLRGTYGVVGLALLVLLWWIGTDVIGTSGGFASRFSPTLALPDLVSLLTASDLPVHVATSLRRVFIGLAIALAAGIPLGLMVGGIAAFDAATAPSFQFLRMISPLSWMPIAVIAFGVGDAPIYFLLGLGAMWPVLLNTASGVRQLDPAWLQLSRSLSATRMETLTQVVLPGIAPHILTGIRLAIGILWILLVPCEMLGVSAGLGYFILDARDRLAYPDLMATVIVIGIIGFALDWAAQKLPALVGLGNRSPAA